MKEVNGVKIAIKNLIIGAIVLVVLSGLIANFLYNVLGHSYYESTTAKYNELKSDFRVGALTREVDDEEVLEELTYFLGVLASHSQEYSAYNYGCIVDHETGEVLRESDQALYTFQSKFKVAHDQREVDNDIVVLTNHVIDINGTGLDGYEYGPNMELSYGTFDALNAKDLASYGKAFEKMKTQLNREGFYSAYSLTSDFFTSIFRPTTEYMLADRITTIDGKVYDLYYYTFNKNWVTKGFLPNYDNILDKFGGIAQGEKIGCIYAISSGDGMKYSYDVTVNPDKVVVDFVLKVLLVVDILMVLLCSVFGYSKQKEIYNREQYRKVLIDSMAHDLKSPLMSMSGFAENLKENVHTEKREYYADSILENINYMNQIINDNLEISRLDHINADMKKEKLDLVQVLKEKIDHYDNEMQAKKLSVKVSGAFSVEGDARMLGMVAENLVTNCIRYSSENSEIAIAGNDSHLVISNSTDQVYKGSLKSFWEPFTKGDDSRNGRKGTGLGLAIVARILDNHKLKYKLSYNKANKQFACTIKK